MRPDYIEEALMGCNMYLHVEARDSSQRLPAWHYVPGEFYDGRNYAIFALLAGVRNNEGIEPLDDPRGLPRDVTSEVWDIYHAEPDVDPHPEYRVTSWFTLAELEVMVDWPRFRSVWHEIDFCVDTMTKLRNLAKHNSDVRIVFWFDDTIADLECYEQQPFSFTARG